VRNRLFIALAGLGLVACSYTQPTTTREYLAAVALTDGWLATGGQSEPWYLPPGAQLVDASVLPPCPAQTTYDTRSGACIVVNTPAPTKAVDVTVAKAPTIAPTPTPTPMVPKCHESDPHPCADQESMKLKMQRTFDSWEGRVMFAYASQSLSPNARRSLQRLVEPAKASARIEVIGRTDASGDAQRNARLALGRALAVRDFLATGGVAKEKVQVAALACTEQAYACIEVEDGRELRRVDISMYATLEHAKASPLAMLTSHVR
jgi:outer membrane protein OmpA-like peptidoglycan-associated protein